MHFVCCGHGGSGFYLPDFLSREVVLAPFLCEKSWPELSSKMYPAAIFFLLFFEREICARLCT